MEKFVLTGDDTFIVNGQVITDMANGDVVTVVMDNDISATVVGKNKNTIIAKDEQGALGTVTFRLLKGTSQDRMMNNYYKTYVADSATFILGTGSMSKRLGDGSGNVTFDNYMLKAGHFNRQPSEATINVNGSTDQAVTVYSMRFLIERVI